MRINKKGKKMKSRSNSNKNNSSALDENNY